jgi:hypothetical protein
MRDVTALQSVLMRCALTEAGEGNTKLRAGHCAPPLLRQSNSSVAYWHDRTIFAAMHWPNAGDDPSNESTPTTRS